MLRPSMLKLQLKLLGPRQWSPFPYGNRQPRLSSKPIDPYWRARGCIVANGEESSIIPGIIVLSVELETRPVGLLQTSTLN